MKIETSEGTSVGAIFDYATHSTSLGPGNMLVSGDVLGLSAQFTEKILGKEVITPVFAGASGNIDPWYRILPGFNTEPGWTPEPVLLGTMLGQEVVHVYRRAAQPQPVDQIRSALKVLQLPAKPPAEGSTEPPADRL